MKTAYLIALILFAGTHFSGLRSEEGRLHESESKGVRSIDSEIEATISFRNKSTELIRIYWLDFNSNRVLYRELNPGKKRKLKTYLTHPWLITDKNDNAIGVYYPDPQSRMITISEKMIKPGFLEAPNPRHSPEP